MGRTCKTWKMKSRENKDSEKFIKWEVNPFDEHGVEFEIREGVI